MNKLAVVAFFLLLLGFSHFNSRPHLHHTFKYSTKTIFPWHYFCRGTVTASWALRRPRWLWLVQRHTSKPEHFCATWSFCRDGSGCARLPNLSPYPTVATKKEKNYCKHLMVQHGGLCERGPALCEYYVTCMPIENQRILHIAPLNVLMSSLHFVLCVR